jgi:hypothetical protein
MVPFSLLFYVIMFVLIFTTKLGFFAHTSQKILKIEGHHGYGIEG